MDLIIHRIRNDNLAFQPFEHNINSRNVHGYHVFMRFFKDMILKGKETIDHNILVLELGQYYEVQHIPYKFIRDAGSRAWRELNNENKALFNNRANVLNNRPIPGKLLIVPNDFDTDEIINDAIKMELTESV